MPGAMNHRTRTQTPRYACRSLSIGRLPAGSKMYKCLHIWHLASSPAVSSGEGSELAFFRLPEFL
jgi:hypothetical protein